MCMYVCVRACECTYGYTYVGMCVNECMSACRLSLYLKSFSVSNTMYYQMRRHLNDEYLRALKRESWPT
jgi:hypothetical protein